MRITESRLKQIIRQEARRVLGEASLGDRWADARELSHHTPLGEDRLESLMAELQDFAPDAAAFDEGVNGDSDPVDAAGEIVGEFLASMSAEYRVPEHWRSTAVDVVAEMIEGEIRNRNSGESR